MSDRDQWPDNPNDVPRQQSQPQEPKSGGGCLKVALIVGGIGFFGMLVCCGGLFWFGRGLLPKMVTTPAEVAALGQEVMKIDIPADFVGQAGMSMDNFAMTMKFANYQHKEQKGTLMIGSMHVKIGDPKDHQAAFNNQKAQQSVAQEGLKITTTADREFTIRGKPVTFKFSEAEKEGTDKKFRLVSSEFESGGGLMMFQLTLEEEAYDEEAVVKMIESIQ
ncbi:MAG: hypothetical protein AABP62_28800 [Planctomycetota bacterium]